MKNILFPTDFSEDSANALRFVQSMGLQHHNRIKITLLNVYQATTSPRRPFIEEGTLHQKTIQLLNDFAKSALEDHPLTSIRLKAVEGYVTRCLIDLSKSPLYDMIVMHTDREHDWLSRFFGTRTTTVAAGAHCPVLVLPGKQKFTAFSNILVKDLSSGKKDGIINSHLHHLNLAENASIEFFRKGKQSLKTKAFSYRKEKKEVLAKLEQSQAELLVVALENKNLLQQLRDYAFNRRFLMDLNIPILVLNGNILQGKALRMYPPIQLAKNSMAKTA